MKSRQCLVLLPPSLVQVGVVVLDELAPLLLHQDVEGLVHSSVKSC